MLIDAGKFMKRSRYSATTRELYSHYLEDLAGWLVGRKLSPEDLDEDSMVDWLDAHPNWKLASRYSAVNAVKAFLRWKYGGKHPALAFRVKRPDPGPQRTLDEEQVEQLLQSLNTGGAKGIRDLAIITLMLDTGLRAAEICRLEVSRVDLKNRHLDVIVKGGKWGEAVFSEYTASCIAQWLGVREAVAKPGVGEMFVSIKGRKPRTAMNKDGLRSVFRQFGKKAGLGLISPHDMRRTFATLASRAGAPTRLVQKAGRWQNIQMVVRYTQALKADDIEPYSPVMHVMKLIEED